MDAAPGWHSPAEDASTGGAPCPTCGTANAADARFCRACGRTLIEPEPELRRLEVLTAVVGEAVSTSATFALAVDADDRLSAARQALLAAGGELRELPGSPHTVAAVFGPAPRDGGSTLRAVRAALSARDALTGGDVALRVGVGASDVAADDDHAAELWQGRVVDLALRLSRMAAPAEIILGEGAYRLIRDDVDAEPVDPRADPDGDDVGPLRLRGVRTGVEPPAEQSSVDAPAWSNDAWAASEPNQIEPAWTDAWTDAFGSAPAGAVIGPDDQEPWDAASSDGPAIEPPQPFEPETSHAVDPEPVRPEDPGPALDDAPPVDAAPLPVDDIPDAAPDAQAPVDEMTDAAPDAQEPIDDGPPSSGSAAVGLLEREPVLRRLHDELDGAIAERRPVTLTLGGRPGSGRTSVARWFAGETADRAWTVEIACRRPDAGGAAWPFGDLVRALLGIDGPADRPDVEARARAALDGGADPDRHAASIGSYLSPDPGGIPPAETRAAIGALLTATVARRPLVVIVDDADRATAGSRAVFDAVVASVAGPMLVVLVGGSGDVDTPRLSTAATAELVERLLSRPNLPPDAIAAIVRACDGIPLAVEQLVAMLADDGHLRWEYGRWTPDVDLASLPLPADLRSLIERRIGGLDDRERRTAAVASVAGERLDASTLAGALGADPSETAAALSALADRGILRRVGDATFSVAHDLIADVAAAYADRDTVAAMHRAIADRLAETRAAGPDVDERIGAHLEQAFRLAGSDPGRETIGRRAADHLARAARGAADVGDADASLALLRRAAAILPVDDAARAGLLLDSAETLVARRERGAAERILGDAVRAARAAGDELVELRASVARFRLLATASRIEDQVEALRDASEAAIAVGTARADPLTTAAGWSARGWVHAIRGHFAAAAHAFERAADAAADAGRRSDELTALGELAEAALDGPAPVEEGVERLRRVLERARGSAVEPPVASALAVALARAGRADEAREMLADALGAQLDDVDVATVRTRAALVELHAGSSDAAETVLRPALDADLGESDRAGVLASLAYVLARSGRGDEALELTDAAASLADEDDAPTQVAWRAARALSLATGGRIDEARSLVRVALRLADQTDLSELRARTRLDLAEVLLAAGRGNEARPAARAALRALERKGSVPEAGRARAILDRAEGRTTPQTAEPGPDTPDDETRSHAEPSAAEDAADRVATPDAFVATNASEPPVADQNEGRENGASEPAVRRERHWFW